MGRFIDIDVDSEPWRGAGVFQLTDPDDDGVMAYSFVSNPDNVSPILAEVTTQEEVRFTPIDFNPDFELLEQSRKRRCDGYLRNRTVDKLIFVELKDRAADNRNSTKKWIGTAIEQLRNAIVLFRKEEPEAAKLKQVGYHRAYVCNPKGPYEVPESVRSKKKMFLTATRTFVLFCNNKITIN